MAPLLRDQGGGGGGLVGGVLYKHGKVGRCKPSESKFGMGKS